MYMCNHVGINFSAISTSISVYLSMSMCIYSRLSIYVCVCVCVYSRHSAHSRGNFRAISVQPVKGDHRRRHHRRVCCRTCSLRICSLRMCCSWMCCYGMWKATLSGVTTAVYFVSIECVLYRVCSLECGRLP